MAERRPDLLAGLTRAGRRWRELEDALLIQRASNIESLIASRQAVERDMQLAGIPGFTAGALKEIQPGDRPDFVICARADLDHPIYFADNLLGECADCGCDVQWRPYAPAGIRLCVCCAARRVREDPDFRDA